MDFTGVLLLFLIISSFAFWFPLSTLLWALHNDESKLLQSVTLSFPMKTIFRRMIFLPFLKHSGNVLTILFMSWGSSRNPEASFTVNSAAQALCTAVGDVNTTSPSNLR